MHNEMSRAEATPQDVVSTLLEHHPRFPDFLVPRVGSREVAEDLLQAAFVRALERNAQLRDGESGVAWFYRLLRNAVVNFYRHRRGPSSARRSDTQATVHEDRTIPDGVMAGQLVRQHGRRRRP